MIAAVLVCCSAVTLAVLAGLLLVHSSSIPPELLRQSIPPVILAVLGCILGTSIQFSFRKTLSAEITMFLVFLALTAFDALKPGVLLLQEFRMPITWSTTLTRIVYFIRFVGIFCFVSAGLFASGLPAQRLLITLGICFFIAFTFSIIVPLDSSIQEDNFLYRLGMQRNIQTALIALEVLAVTNYATAALRKKEKTYLAAAFGAACTITGRELLFFHHSLIYTAAGLTLFLFGAVLYADRIHRIYLWK